jgi:hypothetical protein
MISPEGHITLIRFIRNDRKLVVFGEKFLVSKELVYSYVKAVIVTAWHTLMLYLDNDFVEAFEYQIPSETW